MQVNEIERNMNNTVFVPGDLYRTIYESDPGIKVTASKTNIENARSMLALAVKSNWNMERNAKVGWFIVLYLDPIHKTLHC